MQLVPRGDNFVVLAELSETLSGERFYAFQRAVYDRGLGTPPSQVAIERQSMLRIDPIRVSPTDLRALLDEVLHAVEAALDRQDELHEEETTARARFEAELRLALSESRGQKAGPDGTDAT